MKTVEAIIEAVYGSEKAAAKALGKPSTIATWKNRRYFSARIVPQILVDAMAKGIVLALRDIPTVRRAA